MADLIRWLGLVGLAVLITVLWRLVDDRFATATTALTGQRRWQLTPASMLAPLVAALGLAAVLTRLLDRVRWALLLLAGYLLTAAWAVALATVGGGSALARGLSGPGGYLAAAGRVGDDPGSFLTTFLADAPVYGADVRAHPPLPVLFVWALRHPSPVQLGLLITLIGALVTPLAAVAVRILCGERAARRLVPVLALAPYGLWQVANLDAVTAALAAGSIAAAAVGSRQGRPGPRRLAWAVLCGLLLGTAALFSYAVIWLAAAIPCLYFVRRRPLLNVASGVTALIPLGIVEAAGFSWENGLVNARGMLIDVADPVAVPVWAPYGLVALLLLGGPALAASGRKIRLTPGWPYLVGGALAAAWAVFGGLSRGEPISAWLPFLPWLLVAAVAPERRGGRAPRAPALLIGAGAVTAIGLQAGLQLPW